MLFLAAQFANQMNNKRNAKQKSEREREREKKKKETAAKVVIIQFAHRSTHIIITYLCVFFGNRDGEFPRSEDLQRTFLCVYVAGGQRLWNEINSLNEIMSI